MFFSGCKDTEISQISQETLAEIVNSGHSDSIQNKARAEDSVPAKSLMILLPFLEVYVFCGSGINYTIFAIAQARNIKIQQSG